MAPEHITARYSGYTSCTKMLSPRPHYASSGLITEVIENLIRDYILSLVDSFRDILGSEKFSEAILEAGLTRLEAGASYPLPCPNPTKTFEGINVVGVDGGSFGLSLHPLRMIIARTAVFSHSQNIDRPLNLRDCWRASVVLLREIGPLEDCMRRKSRETLASLEATTVAELVEEYASALDVVIWDGPLYTRRFLRRQYSAVKALADRAIMCIRVVKNVSSARIARTLGLRGITDADIFSYSLPLGFRTPLFLYDGPLVRGLPGDMKPIFFYAKTEQGVLRFEFPLWMLEEYGARRIIDIIAADLTLGGGISYVVSRADQLARFREEEKRHIFFRIVQILEDYGFGRPVMFNQNRWGRFLRK